METSDGNQNHNDISVPFGEVSLPGTLMKQSISLPEYYLSEDTSSPSEDKDNPLSLSEDKNNSLSLSEVEGDWPESVYILDSTCNISGIYGTETAGYPNHLLEWIRFSLGEQLGNKLFLIVCSQLYKVSIWSDNLQKKSDPRYIEILTSEGIPNSVKYWNYRLRLKYNVTWALLGYTENQAQIVLDMAQYYMECPPTKEEVFQVTTPRVNNSIPKGPRYVPRPKPKRKPKPKFQQPKLTIRRSNP